MVMKKTALLALSAFALASLLVIGCKKEHSDTLTSQQEQDAVSYSSEAEAENNVVFDDVFDNVMGVNNEVGVAGTGVFGRIATGINGRELNIDSVHCFTLTVVRLNLPEPFPVRITIDFGAGCMGNDGHMRYGKIITEYTGRLIIPGKSATTRFEGFKFDSISVTGIHKITNTTALGSNQAQYTIDVTDAKLSKPNGNYSEWSSHKVITQVEGNGTIIPIDDVFTITGSAHGRVKHGNDLYAWQSEILEPLRKRNACHWISKGSIRVRRETLPTTSPWVATLDYGDGTCDFLATLTINGVAHQIQLPH
jgi:hypothetical protein